MARSPRRDDEDAVDPVEEAGEQADGEEQLDGYTAGDDEPDLEDDDADVDFDGDGDGDGDEELPEGELDEDDDGTVLPSLLEDDEIAVVVAESEDDDEDALRDGEFVCRSCFMAKRESALADAEAMLCRDCA